MTTSRMTLIEKLEAGRWIAVHGSGECEVRTGLDAVAGDDLIDGRTVRRPATCTDPAVNFALNAVHEAAVAAGVRVRMVDEKALLESGMDAETAFEHVAVAGASRSENAKEGWKMAFLSGGFNAVRRQMKEGREVAFSDWTRGLPWTATTRDVIHAFLPEHMHEHVGARRLMDVEKMRDLVAVHEAAHGVQSHFLPELAAARDSFMTRDWVSHIQESFADAFAAASWKAAGRSVDSVEELARLRRMQQVGGDRDYATWHILGAAYERAEPGMDGLQVAELAVEIVRELAYSPRQLATADDERLKQIGLEALNELGCKAGTAHDLAINAQDIEETAARLGTETALKCLLSSSSVISGVVAEHLVGSYIADVQAREIGSLVAETGTLDGIPKHQPTQHKWDIPSLQMDLAVPSM